MSDLVCPDPDGDGGNSVQAPQGFGLCRSARRRRVAQGEPGGPSVVPVAGQQRGEQDEQIENRKPEQAVRGAAIAMTASIELPREPDQDQSTDGSREAIDRAGKAK